MEITDLRFTSSNAEVREEDVLSLAKTIASKRYDRIGDALVSPDLVREFLLHSIGFREQEVFMCLLLDNKHRPIVSKIMFYGTIDSASVYPREIVKLALKHNSAAVIVAHNHTSGAIEPSDADLSLTRRIKDALALVDIRLLDHLICGQEVVSLSERGDV